MKTTPCAINSQPPLVHIHSCPETEAGCHDVPEPWCGEGSLNFALSSIFICIPAMSCCGEVCPVWFSRGASWAYAAESPRQSAIRILFTGTSCYENVIRKHVPYSCSVGKLAAIV